MKENLLMEKQTYIRRIGYNQKNNENKSYELNTCIIPLLVSAIKGDFSRIEYENDILSVLINMYMYQNDIFGISLNIYEYDKNYHGSYNGIESIIYLILYFNDLNIIKYFIKLNWMTNFKNIRLWLNLCRQFDNYPAFKIVEKHLQSFSCFNISTKRQLDKTSDFFKFKHLNYYFNRNKHNFLLVKLL